MQRYPYDPKAIVIHLYHLSISTLMLSLGELARRNTSVPYGKYDKIRYPEYFLVKATTVLSICLRILPAYIKKYQ